MKKLILVLFVGMIVAFGFSDGTKNDVVAVYDIDSVQNANTWYTSQKLAAENKLKEDREHYSSAVALHKASKGGMERGLPAGMSTSPSPEENKKMENQLADMKSKVERDSVYLSDSVSALSRIRLMKISGDFQKTFGYKMALTKEELAMYKLTSNGAGAKSENVTKRMIEFANQDSIVRKY